MQQLCVLPFRKVTSHELLEIRRDEMADIEEDVEEVFLITQELNRLVELQDDDIMHIEDVVESSHHDVEQATNNIQKASNSRWRTGTVLFTSTIFLVGSILLIVLI